MAHNVPVLYAFLLIRPCCQQLHWAGSSVLCYLLKWEGERVSIGLIYCLCRGESAREEGWRVRKRSEILSLTCWSWVRQVGVWARVKEESKWMKRCWFFSLLIHRRLYPNFSASSRPLWATNSSVSLSWEPVIDLIWPQLNKSLSGITQHASRSAESSALMLFWRWRERRSPSAETLAVL